VRSDRRRPRTTRALALALLAWTLPADGADPSACAKLQIKAAAAGAKAKAACHAKAAGTGSPVDQTCVAAADEKLARKWEKATLRGDCPTSADAAVAQGLVDAFVAGLLDALEPPTVSYCCDTGTACYAGPVIDASTCLELLGTLGPPGSVCEGATGACVPPPGTGGSCCAFPQFSVCTAGPSADPAGCVTGGGLDVPFAVCLPSGACAFP
jgi:hypothetical protein